RRRALHPKLAVDRGLQDAVGRGEAVHGGGTFVGRAQDAHEHLGVAQVGAGADIGHGDEPDARVLQKLHRVAEDLPHGLVHATHAISAHPIPGISSNDVTAYSTRTPSGNRLSAKRPILSASPSAPWAVPATAAATTVERCHLSWCSTSATATPRRPRSWSVNDFSSLRLALRSWTSEKCRWIVTSATYP